MYRSRTEEKKIGFSGLREKGSKLRLFSIAAQLLMGTGLSVNIGPKRAENNLG